MYPSWNVSRVVVHMQADLPIDAVPPTPSGLQVRLAQPTASDDQAVWSDLIRRSYPDVDTAPDLAQFVDHHRFLRIHEVWLVSQANRTVGTIALGPFLANSRVGGVARIAVAPQARGQGIGGWMIAAAYRRLSDLGCQRGESVITNTRHESIRIHAALGFRLQRSASAVQDVGQVRRWPAKEIAIRRARKVAGAQRIARGSHMIKRAADLLIASAAMILALPCLLIAGIVIKRDSPGPILYKEERVGRHRRPFTPWKLRTMRVDDGTGIHPEHRITAPGRWLRRWSIDELPQLVNVLKGDMSVVGPRPLADRQLRGLPPEHEVRFEVRPGLTGLAQVSGRNDLPRVKRWALDAQYAREHDLRMDLRILASTIRVVFTGAGSQYPDATVQDAGLR